MLFLIDTNNHMNSIKLKDYMVEIVTDFCDAILVDSEHLDSAGTFNTNQLCYIIHIFEDTYDSRFLI